MFIQRRVAVCLACFSLFSLSGICHTQLVSSIPQNGQVLSRAPHHIVVRFSSPIEKKLSELQLSGDNGQSWLTLKSNFSPKTTSLKKRYLQQKSDVYKNLEPDRTLIADFPELHPAIDPATHPVTYKVRWRVLSKDGHVQRGEFSFALRSRTNPRRAD